MICNRKNKNAQHFLSNKQKMCDSRLPELTVITKIDEDQIPAAPIAPLKKKTLNFTQIISLKSDFTDIFACTLL